MMKCAVHPEVEAVGACCSCGRFVCPECKVIIGGQTYCNRCVAARLDNGAWPGQAAITGYASGTGSGTPVPQEIRGWSWGGFLMTWIWGIGNNVWIALISLLGLIPTIGWVISLVMRIVLGIKGNEWAWQNKKWQSVEHFKQTQRKWAWWGLAIILLEIALVLAVIVLAVSLYMIYSTVGELPDWRDYLPQ